MIDPTTECGDRKSSVSWPSGLVWEGVLKSAMAIVASPSESQSNSGYARHLTGAAGLGVCDTSCSSGEGYPRGGWSCLPFLDSASALSLPGIAWCDGYHAHRIMCCVQSIASSRASHRSELGTGPVGRHHCILRHE